MRSIHVFIDPMVVYRPRGHCSFSNTVLYYDKFKIYYENKKVINLFNDIDNMFKQIT